jgi:hypothetical protein
MGFVVGRAFAANAHVDVAHDAALRVLCKDTVHDVKRRVLPHVLLGVGVAGQGLARKIFLVAKPPVGEELRPGFGGRRWGSKWEIANGRASAARVSSMVGLDSKRERIARGTCVPRRRLNRAVCRGSRPR